MFSKKEDIPSGLHTLVESLDLKIQKIFLVNNRKRTATLLAQKKENKEKRYLLKYCSENTPELEKRRFKNEIEYYLKNNFLNLSPEFVKGERNYLLLEYIPSNTLRECLISYLKNDSSSEDSKKIKNFINRIVNQILNQYDSIIQSKQNENIKIPIETATERLLWLFANMSNSGPYYTSRSLIARAFSKILFLASKKTVKKRIHSTLSQNSVLLTSGFMHGDTHLDNFIVSKKNQQLYLIDYAIHERQGLVIFDLVYFLSTLLTLLDAKKEYKYFLTQKVEERGNPIFKDVLKLSVLFHQIGKTNSRFNSEASNFRIVYSYFKCWSQIHSSTIKWEV